MFASTDHLSHFFKLYIDNTNFTFFDPNMKITDKFDIEDVRTKAMFADDMLMTTVTDRIMEDLICSIIADSPYYRRNFIKQDVNGMDLTSVIDCRSVYMSSTFSYTSIYVSSNIFILELRRQLGISLEERLSSTSSHKKEDVELLKQAIKHNNMEIAYYEGRLVNHSDIEQLISLRYNKKTAKLATPIMELDGYDKHTGKPMTVEVSVNAINNRPGIPSFTFACNAEEDIDEITANMVNDFALMFKSFTAHCRNKPEPIQDTKHGNLTVPSKSKKHKPIIRKNCMLTMTIDYSDVILNHAVQGHLNRFMFRPQLPGWLYKKELKHIYSNGVTIFTDALGNDLNYYSMFALCKPPRKV
jgi:hypothetical protein